MRRSFFCLWVVMGIGQAVLSLASADPFGLSELDAGIRQAVIVRAEPGEIEASVSGWERVAGEWRRTIPSVEAVIGRNGLAAPREKKEGDGHTPSGTFVLRRAFGYDADAPTGLEYRQATEKDFWIDEPASPHYNQWVSGEVPGVSHEVLRRADELYKYAVIVEYNTDTVVPGNGSAIFMHVWHGAGQPTAGCVAMAEEDLLRFLRWLERTHGPVIIIGSF